MQGHCENYNGWGHTTKSRQVIVHTRWSALHSSSTHTSVQPNPDTATITPHDTFKEEMESQHADKWKQAMDPEMGRLKENDVYDLISRAAVPFNHKVIGTRWVY